MAEAALNLIENKIQLDAERVSLSPLQHNRELVAELDQHYTHRHKGCSTELQKIRDGIPGVIRENLSDSAVAAVLNDQLMRISEKEVDVIIDSFPKEYQEAAREVLAIISEYSTYQSLSGIVTALNTTAEAMPKNGGNVYYAGGGSLIDSLIYLKNLKKILPGEDIKRTNLLSGSEIVLVDRSLIDKIRNDKSFAEEIVSKPKTFIFPLAFHGAITPFNSQLPSQIAERVESVLKECILYAEAERGDNFTELMNLENLPELVNNVLSMSAETEFRSAFWSQQIDSGSEIQMEAVPLRRPEGKAGCESSVICERLNGRQRIDAENVQKAFTRLPENYYIFAREMVVQESYVLSQRSIAVAAYNFNKVLDRILQRKQISRENVYLYVSDEYKSLSVLSQAVSEQFGIKSGNILRRKDRDRIPVLSEKSVCLIADDFIGSGQSVNDMYCHLRDYKYAGEVCLFSVLADKGSHRAQMDLGRTVATDIKCHSIADQWIKPFQQTGLFKSACEQGKKILGSLIGSSGYGNSGLLVSMPYMVPDNTCSFFGKSFGRYLVGGDADKTAPYSAPEKSTIGMQIKATTHTAKVHRTAFREEGEHIDTNRLVASIRDGDLLSSACKTDKFRYLRERLEIRKARKGLAEMLNKNLSVELDRMEDQLNYLDDMDICLFAEISSDIGETIQGLFSVQKEFREKQPGQYERLKKFQKVLKAKTGNFIQERAKEIFDIVLERGEDLSGKIDICRDNVCRRFSEAEKIAPDCGSEATRILRRAFQPFKRKCELSIAQRLTEAERKSLSFDLIELEVLYETTGSSILKDSQSLSCLSAYLDCPPEQMQVNYDMQKRIKVLKEYLHLKYLINGTAEQGVKAFAVQCLDLVEKLPSLRKIASSLGPAFSKDAEKLSRLLAANLTDCARKFSQLLTEEDLTAGTLIDLHYDYRKFLSGVDALINNEPENAEKELVALCVFDKVSHQSFKKLLLKQALILKESLIEAKSDITEMAKLLPELEDRLDCFIYYKETRSVAVDIFRELRVSLPAVAEQVLFSPQTKAEELARRKFVDQFTTQKIISLKEIAAEVFSQKENDEMFHDMSCSSQLLKQVTEIDEAPHLQGATVFRQIEEGSWHSVCNALINYRVFIKTIDQLEGVDMNGEIRDRAIAAINKNRNMISELFFERFEWLEDKLNEDPDSLSENVSWQNLEVLELLDKEDLAEYWLGDRVEPGRLEEFRRSREGPPELSTMEFIRRQLNLLKTKLGF